MDIWVKIEEFPRYSVSERGEVRNDKTGKLLTPTPAGGRNLQVGMLRDGDRRQYKRYLAKLVANAFVLKDRFPTNSTLIHLDGDKNNCAASNLQWRPMWFAAKYAQQFRTMRNYGMPPLRNVNTGEIIRDVWTEVIMKHGVLWNDIKSSINMRTCVWPSMEMYEWVEE